MARVFNLNLIKFTPQGKLNFIGVTVKYFELINKNWEESTKNQYYNYYTQRIFPLIDISKDIVDYDIDYIEYLVNLVCEKWHYKESTALSTINHLIFDPCYLYFEDCSNEYNPLWGSKLKNISDISDNISPDTKVIKKSFTESEEKQVNKILFRDYKTNDGSLIGLMLLYSTGSRLNEACGVKFKDIQEFKQYKGRYYIILGHTTTMLHSRYLKAGGKTYNSPRKIPLLPKVYDFLMKRKKYIESKISFPFTDERGNTFNTIDDLPIACKNDDYTENLMSDELSVKGRMFFRDILHIRESEIVNIFDDIRNNNDVEEKDATTYLFRRNTATHLFVLGFNSIERAYFMGHKIEDPLIVRRDFNDEDVLYIIYQKYSKHPFLTTAQNEE